jgi:hypothetical protein
MSKMTPAAAVAAGVLFATVLGAQGTAPARGAAPASDVPMMVLLGAQGLVPITQRLPATTLHGTIIEISCFRSMGAATVAAAEQVACAKAAIAKGTGVAGILTDGIGTFQLAGNLTATKFAKLVPYLGKEVDLTGSEVYVSNNFSYHVFEALKITPAKK